MSEGSVDRPPTPSPTPSLPHRRQQRNDENDRQIEIQKSIPKPPPPPVARRIIMIWKQYDVVRVLSAISRSYRQAFYIVAGQGIVKEAILSVLPSMHRCNGSGRILHLSGWFQPILMDTSAAHVPFSSPNGVLYVSLSEPPTISVAHTLLASYCVEVYAVLVCGPGSEVQPDEPGARPLRINVEG